MSAKENPNPVPPSTSRPSDGIRSLKTSNPFRILNYELYARPNKYMMFFGVVAFSSCIFYLAKMNYSAKTTYVAMNDKDELITKTKQSRWQ